jgi:glycosyltransferase involved in cell wall biosynthesis
LDQARQGFIIVKKRGRPVHINIVDPGMRTYAGHHCDINTRIARQLIGRGHQVTIYANRSFRPKQKDTDLRIEPIFSANPYSFRGNRKRLRGYFKYFTDRHLGEKHFANELAKIEPADALFFPTLFPYQLHGLCLSSKELPPTFLVMHNAPEWNNSAGEELWRKAFEASLPFARSLHFGVFETELFLEFERLLPAGAMKLARFPIPHDGVAPRRRTELSVVGILGHQRHTKGLDRLQSNVDRLTQLGFRVIVQDSHERSLEELSLGNPAVSAYGYIDELPSIISECDALLLDYDTEMYRRGGSGIAWEAIACGVPLVVPAGTTMSMLVDKYQCGLKFGQSDREDTFRALQKARENYVELAGNALLASERFRSEHGTAKLIDYLLAQMN